MDSLQRVDECGGGEGGVGWVEWEGGMGVRGK